MRTERLVVMGQGYVGLPIAMRAVEVGYDVVGLDIDLIRVQRLVAGTSFVEDVPDSVVRTALDSGRYLPTTEAEHLHGFDFVIITVPTPLIDTTPDLSFIESSVATIAPHVTPGCTVVLESTTYPGTTGELVVPVLETLSGLEVGADFYVGYSPERIDPGNPTYGFVNTPKVVSGVDGQSLKRVQQLYESLVDRVVPVSGAKEAELTKLLENTFRHVNIALINELAMLTRDLGIDIWEVVDAASTKPFGFMRFTPGPGVGGHCLPVDPSYLSWEVRRTLGRGFRFVDLANDVNEHMPNYVVQRLMLGLNNREKAMKGSVILALGLAYKKNTGDIRESPAMRVCELLSEFGAVVRAVDDHVEDHRVPAFISRVELTRDEVARADAIVLLTEHDRTDYSLLEDAACLVLDTRNILGDFAERI